ncbi:MAG TPA: BON domain-containing protein [Thermoanaerobaculia bacterium]|nr:BON domain-containing protein [Thermoanaerobaculia bacterium]
MCLGRVAWPVLTRVSDRRSTNIEVNSTNGVVTLAGQVPNHLDKLKAEEVARSVEGVVRVNNDLQVENPERM